MRSNQLFKTQKKQSAAKEINIAKLTIIELLVHNKLKIWCYDIIDKIMKMEKMDVRTKKYR